ncbi:MAG: 4a-hydroxytetrahydrobiopterin dehydratase [Bacteroidetes bacterium]|nr:4a-hydroxytetrahydrobiopterin dehydratase [Bacteroidota bacterium]
MIELKERHCRPCKEGEKPLNSDQAAELKSLLLTPWHIKEHEMLTKEFVFENFKRAMAFVQEIGLIAEQENHHPAICIHYTRVEITLSTHDVGGLSENDFIVAAKIEDL